MTLNFKTHGPHIQAAYDRVVSSKTGDEWVIYDYEGNSNVIRVGDEGDGGLDEFSNSFNSGRLQYGLINVKLSEKAMSKIVLVHWQGEGVPSARVASSTSHVNDVRRYLKTVHTVVYARSEMDVEPDSIKKEVAKLPAAYSESKVETSYSAPTSVSSVYRPVKPHVDINVKEREQFWDKMNVEEKQRQAEQLRKHNDDEKKWTEERNQLADQITQKKETENSSATKVTSNPVNSNPNPLSKLPETSAGGNKLISQRLGMFENKEYQPIPILPNSSPKSNLFNNSFNKLSVSEEPKSVNNNITTNHTTRDISLKSGPEPYVPSLYDFPPTEVPTPVAVKTPPPPAPVLQKESLAPSQYDIPPAPLSSIDQYDVPPVLPTAAIDQYDVPPVVETRKGLCAMALWDYQAADATEISFDPNDIISEINQIDEGWWQGKAPNGSIGLFPSNYVSLI